MKLSRKRLFRAMLCALTVSLIAILGATICAAESDFSAISSTSTHASTKFDENYLIDGNYSKTASLWVSSDNSRPTTSAETNLTPKTDVILTLTLAKTQDVSGVVLWPHMGYNNEEAGQYFPRGFDIIYQRLFYQQNPLRSKLPSNPVL